MYSLENIDDVCLFMYMSYLNACCETEHVQESTANWLQSESRIALELQESTANWLQSESKVNNIVEFMFFFSL